MFVGIVAGIKSSTIIASMIHHHPQFYQFNGFEVFEFLTKFVSEISVNYALFYSHPFRDYILLCKVHC